MASVFLRFTPPDIEDLKFLRIFEANSSSGPWTQIEEVDIDALGVSYPDYISEYETNAAASAVDWFSISWVGEKGAETERSNPIQGGTETLVGEISALVMERDETLDPQVVRQEVEFALEGYFNQDPYTVHTSSYRVKVGIARLVQARTIIATSVSGSGSSSGWTAGLVSMKSGTGTASSDNYLKYLLEQASEALGLTIARVAQMAEMPIAGGLSTYPVWEGTPVLVEVE